MQSIKTSVKDEETENPSALLDCETSEKHVDGWLKKPFVLNLNLNQIKLKIGQSLKTVSQSIFVITMPYLSGKYIHEQNEAERYARERTENCVEYNQMTTFMLN